MPSGTKLGDRGFPLAFRGSSLEPCKPTSEKTVTTDLDIFRHYERFPAPQEAALVETVQSFLGVLPGANLTISWGMPTLALGNTPALSLEGFTGHNSVFPGPDTIARLGSALEGYTVTKGTIHFSRDRAMPKTLVRAIAKAAVASVNARYPKADGSFLEYYDNGHLKARGHYRDGQMHKAWSWFRRDGSLMRTGSFREGVAEGTWQTYLRDGTLHGSR